MNQKTSRGYVHPKWTFQRSVVFAGTVIAMVLCLTRQAAAQTVVATNQGLVQGTISASGTSRTFLGIPYAAPPTGIGTRFTAPQPHAAWLGTPYGLTAGKKCIQASSGSTNLDTSSSEDCLYLNVVTPLGPGLTVPSNLAVVVSIPGGFWMAGDGSTQATDALPTAKLNQVVFVSINYRLGIFGFLADPRIDDGEGNLGLKDMQFALQWVHDNIANFGGNPNNVTVLGDSAGGISICALVTSPGTPNFQKAILESATCAVRFRTVAAAQPIGAQLIALAGCNLGTTLATQACLTVAPVQSLFNAEMAVWQAPWNGSGPPLPTFQGFPTEVVPFSPSVAVPAQPKSVVPQQPLAAITSSTFHGLPILIGTTHDEARLTVLTNNAELYGDAANPLNGLTTGGNGMTESEYATAVANAYFSQNANNPKAASTNAASVLAQYNHGTPLFNWTTALTDWGWACPSWIGYNAFAGTVAPIYAFEFASPNGPGANTLSNFPLGAPHDMTSEYRAGGLVLDAFFVLNPAENTLSQQIIEYWTNFAATEDPNAAGLPMWSRYSPTASGGQNVQQLNSGGKDAMINLYTEHNCDFWFTALTGAYAFP
jgi:para-nitrobenzyl esterase